MLVASLRDAIRSQSQEIEDLKSKLREKVDVTIVTDEVRHITKFDRLFVENVMLQRVALQNQVATLTAELRSSEEKRKEVEKEQEDLLVLLDEVSSKRKRDKERMRQAGLEVSEDEGDADNEDE
jgi:intracellular protein transport protein USO1